VTQGPDSEGYRHGVSEEPLVRYRSSDEDSHRWVQFPFRPGDVVISTRSKSGTTWMQMICALLVFQTPEFPEPLGDLSPWLDWLITPQAEVYARLAAQRHRRIIKTHTPLDGIPLDPLATYIVVARDPLDLAVSLYHQSTNLNRDRMGQPSGSTAPAEDLPPRPEIHEWLVAWTEWDGSPAERMDSLPGVMAHLSDAWARRGERNVVLVHYDDLLGHLEGEMRRLADRLAIVVPEEAWSRLVHAARFEQMRARARRVVPDPEAVLKDQARFFRRGSSGEGREVLSRHEVARYRDRVQHMGPPELVRWLHRWEP
jgi:aryl sulfotransferase